MYIIILHVNYHPRPIMKSTYVMKVIVVNCNVSDKGNTAAYENNNYLGLLYT